MIYPNKEAAKQACKDYLEKVYKMQEEMGLWEECEDSCVATHTYAKYYDEKGEIKKYCHF